MTLTLLTGCTSAMKKYAKEVDEAGMNDKIEEIQTKSREVYDLIDQVFEELDLETGDMDSLTGYDEAKDALDDLQGLIDDATEQAEAFETKKTEVADANALLLEGLGFYGEFSDMMNGIYVFAGKAFEIVAAVNQANLDSTTLGLPSDEYSVALMTYMEENAAVLGMLDGFDFETVLSSGEIDEASFSLITDTIQTLLTGLNDLPVVNDVDKSYNELFTNIYGSVNEMITLMLDNKDLLKVLSAFEDGDEYMTEVETNAQEKFDEWEDAMNQ